MSPGRPRTWLDCDRRSASLARAAHDGVDLLVVGGGVTGAGVALDAASRGLSVALVEKADLANGTSRWSSKLVHGGLRYLASGSFGVAWESARERGILMRHTAPHLVRALAFVTPLGSGSGRVSAAVTEAGLRVGDGLRAGARTSARDLPRPRRIPALEARQLVPGLDPRGLRGALMHWDGQLEDDARLVVALARTAAGQGAHVLTYTEAVDVRAGGATLRDTVTGERLEVRARAVVNATGVWASRLAPSLELRPSRGSHVIVPAAALGHPRAALNVPVPGQFGRYVFAVPHPDGLVHIGLTDEPVDGVSEEPRAPEADVDHLLRSASAALAIPLTRDQVLGSYAGLRPLLAGKGQGTAELSRRHAVLEDPAGVVTVVGGKLTTYRAMARDAVDRAVALHGLDAGPCVTERLPLVGAAPPAGLAAVRAPARLVRRYGAEAPQVLELARDDPRLAEPVVEGSPVLGAELVFGVVAEGALYADDLLARRTRLSLVPQRERGAADALASLDVASRLLARGVLSG